MDEFSDGLFELKNSEKQFYRFFFFFFFIFEAHFGKITV